MFRSPHPDTHTTTRTNSLHDSLIDLQKNIHPEELTNPYATSDNRIAKYPIKFKKTERVDRSRNQGIAEMLLGKKGGVPTCEKKAKCLCPRLGRHGGFTDPSTTPVALEGKMRTLLSAYKCAKDNASRTGAAPCIAPNMDEMEEIFGYSALLSNNHTLNVGRCRAQPVGTPPPPQQADSPQPALPSRPIASFSQPPLPHRPTAQPSRSLLLAPPPSPAASAHPARSLLLVPSQRPAVSHTASALSAYPTTSPLLRASQHPTTSHLAAASPYTELCPQPISPQPAVSPSPPTSPHPESSQQPPSQEAESPQPVTSKRRRKTARERYYEEKLILKERKLEEKKRFHDSVVKMMREVEMKKT
ncbi:translation initiation factor IF-2-like [Rhagoletis pomonella]|uniref:translation initiation factor IF-2-like n=1 Tax=Rhagoletis pomonella TaxID=28610 RepID=UPI0017870C65|nr:translation initiation factor IF-2-like [Rhagoletis pomonella]